MSLKRLRAVGLFDAPAEGAQDASQDFVDRRAMLVYAGEFESMEGPVRVSDDQVKGLVTTHNSTISKLKRLAAFTPLRHYPPVQLDHSTSARDTVGRLVGDIELGEYEYEDGRRVPAVYGTLRILGKENVERVKDGRWTHLSLGADFDRGRISELSVTPFPAAADASMLSAKKRREVYCDYPDGKTRIEVEVDDGDGKYYASVGGKAVGDGFATKETAVEEARKAFTAKEAPLPTETPQGDTHLAEGGACKACMEKWMSHEKDKGTPHDKAVAIAISECKEHCKTQPLGAGDMDTAKLKCYLTGHKKMSEKDADDHLSRLAKPEHAEEMKKLSMDFEAWAKEEEKEHAKKLTAAREGITKLSGSMKANVDAARLAAASGRIMTRLTKLRAQGKVTPAEIKKMDIAKLAASSQKDVDLVLKTYDDREPVILPGQVGTVKGTDLSRLSDERQKISKLEAESRANMSMLRNVDGAKTKLASDHEGGRTEGGAPPPVNADSDEDRMAHLEKESEEISKLWGEGKHHEAKERLKKYMSHRGESHLSAAHEESTATEAHLSALADTVEKMQADFDQLTKLTADVLG